MSPLFFCQFKKNHRHFKGKNREKNHEFVKKNGILMAKQLCSVLGKEPLEQWARETGFVQRKSTITGARFLEMLMFNRQPGSLTDLTDDLELNHGLQVTKQGLDERFNDRAVNFLERVLSAMVSNTVEKQLGSNGQSAFSSCLVRDSSRFGLPDSFSDTYRGPGGATKTQSMISVQYELDLLSGTQHQVQLTSGRRNDQQDARESTGNIVENSLLIRDLGYVTTTYLKSVIEKGAYFLNRLPSQVSVLDRNKGLVEMDFGKVYGKMKRHGITVMEFDVMVSRTKPVPCRLIVYINDEKTRKQRLKKTHKQTKSVGYKVSKEQKTRSKLDMYITNVNPQIIGREQVKGVYSLRWQVENIFKIWKSLCHIDKVKKVKIQRFQCMLMAGLIWIMANWKVFQMINKWFDQHQPGRTASTWKFFKYAVRFHEELRDMMFKDKDPIPLLKKIIERAETRFFRESKKGKKTLYGKFGAA